MPAPISLEEAERRAFTATWQGGLWDVFIGSFALLFAVAPPLSTTLGDFWGSAVFLPFRGLLALAIWWLKGEAVWPRVGTARFGASRKSGLRRLTLLMLMVNLLALALGVVAFVTAERSPAHFFTIVLALLGLVGFSLAAYRLGLRRLFVYGLLWAAAALGSEWLHANAGVAHHGYPFAYGATAAAIIASGLYRFVRLMRHTPAADRDYSPGRA